MKRSKTLEILIVLCYIFLKKESKTADFKRVKNKMAKYKDYSYDQGVFLPVFFDKQILPGTFEYSLNHLIDNEVDLTIFDKRYNNDETGA